MLLVRGSGFLELKKRRCDKFRKRLRCFGVFCFLLLVSLRTPVALGQLSTEDHLAEPGFWPTQDSASREGFVGSDACARCHGSKVDSQKRTPMARAAMSASLSDILHAQPLMVFKPGEFQYRIETGPSKSNYSVSHGSQSLSSPLLWAFGTGLVGQSYLFKRQSEDFFEARATYFSALGTLGFTPSRELLSPLNIEEAMDRPVDKAEVIRKST